MMIWDDDTGLGYEMMIWDDDTGLGYEMMIRDDDTGLGYEMIRHNRGSRYDTYNFFIILLVHFFSWPKDRGRTGDFDNTGRSCV